MLNCPSSVVRTEYDSALKLSSNAALKRDQKGRKDNQVIFISQTMVELVTRCNKYIKIIVTHSHLNKNSHSTVDVVVRQ